jgi:hypothetical protein
MRRPASAFSMSRFPITSMVWTFIHLFSGGDLRFDVVAVGVELGADFVGSEFGLNGARVFDVYWP